VRSVWSPVKEGDHGGVRVQAAGQKSLGLRKVRGGPATKQAQITPENYPTQAKSRLEWATRLP